MLKKFAGRFSKAKPSHRVIALVVALLLAFGFGCSLADSSKSGSQSAAETDASVLAQSEARYYDELRLNDSALIGDLEVTLDRIRVSDEGVTLDFIGILQEGNDGAEIALEDIVGDDIEYHGVEKTIDTVRSFKAVFEKVGSPKVFSVTFEGFELVQVSISHQRSSATWIVGNDTGIAAKRGSQPEFPNLEVVFLDVGQADAVLISQGNHYMLIDGGNVGDSSLIYSVLKARGITKLDYIINSHPDEDHVGGLSGALQIAEVGRAFSSVREHDTQAFNNFKQKLAEKGAEITVPNTGDAFTFAGSVFTFIQPDKGYDDVNDDSLVVMLAYRDTKFLFTGDIGQRTEQDLAESQTDIEVDVLKVAHHGSAYSSTYQFLRAANPKYAVLSVGADNSYGHPTDEALSRLRDQGAHLYRTDLQGDVTITSDGKTIDVQTAKTPTGDVYAPNNTYEEAPPATSSSQGASASQGSVATAVPPAPSADNATVYKTNTGKKYHANGCRHLSKSKIETTRGAAKAEGLTPCSVCNPG